MASKKTISQRISIEGGDEIRKEFEALGEEGKKAFELIKRHIEGTRTPFQQFSKGVADVRRDLAPVGRAFGDLGRSVQTFARNLALIGGAIAGAGAGIVALTRNATAAADEIGKAAQGAGIGAEAFQRLGFAAEQSGLSQSDFVAGLTRLNQQITRAAEGNKAAADRFAELGVRIKDAAGNLRPTAEILRDLADAFQRLPNDARAAGLGSEFFGRSIARWLPLLREGGAAIEALGDQFESSVGGFSEAQIALATEVNDAWSAMGKALTNLRHQIGLSFASSLLRGIAAFHDIIARNREAIIGFASDIASRVEPVVRDLFNTLTGNDLLVVDKRFVEWRDSITGFGRDVAGIVTGVVVPAFRGIVAAADGVATAVRTMTGGFIDFSGRQLAIGAALLGLTGGFRVLRDMIRLTSAALLFLSRHPIVAGITILSGGLLFLAGRQGEAAEAADSHREAIDQIDQALRRLRGNVPSAGDELVKFTRQTLENAKASLQAADAQLQFAEAARRGERGRGGVPSEQDRDIERARAQVAKSMAELDEAERKLAEVEVAVRKADREVQNLDRSTREFGRAAQEAGDKAARAFPGPAAHVRTLGIDDPFATAKQGAEDFGAAVETEGARAETAFGKVVTAARDIGPAVGDGFTGIETQASQTAQNLPGLFTTAANTIAEAFTAAFARIRSDLDALTSAVTAAIGRMSAEIARLRAALRSAQSQASAGGGGGSGPGFAFGGPVRGPGTSTSDSILAWLSAGEFVVQARAVRRYGLRFIRALNEGILPKLPGFAAGGLVDVPRFNFGGLADAAMHSLDALRPQPMGTVALAGIGGGSPKTLTPVHLNFKDGETVVLQTISDGEVVAALQRVAHSQSRRSGGTVW